MKKSKIGVSPPRQSKAKPKDPPTPEMLQKKIDEYEAQIPIIRDEIFNLQVELFKATSPTKKEILRPILQSIDNSNKEYISIHTKYELSRNLVRQFKKIIESYPVDRQLIQAKKEQEKQKAAAANKRPKTLSGLKPILKQITDFYHMTPLERTQMTNRVGLSRIVLKKKLEVYQNPQLTKSLAPLDNDISASNENNSTNSKQDETDPYIELLERDLVLLKETNDRLIQRFGTNSGFRISSQIKYGRKVNQSLRNEVEEFTNEMIDLKKQIQIYEAKIQSMDFPSKYERMVDEGQICKKIAEEKLNDLFQEAKEREDFFQEVLIGIEKVSIQIDPKHPSSGNPHSELAWIKEKISTQILGDDNSATFPSKVPLDKVWNLSTTLQKTDDVENVPELNLASISVSDYHPLTRTFRRIFSSMSSIRTNNNDHLNEDVNESIKNVGRLLGNIFVDRFSPIFHQTNTVISVMDRNENMSIPNPLTKTIDLPSLFHLYYKFRSDLHLTQGGNDEIQRSDPDFLQFAAEKELFKKKLDFFVSDFMNLVSDHLNDNDLIPCLWMIHDFSTYDMISLIAHKLLPVFNQNKHKFSVENSSCLPEVVSWAAVIASLFSFHMKSLKETLLKFYDPIFEKYLEKLEPSLVETTASKFSALALLRYGKFFSKNFVKFIEFNQNSASYIHKFIQNNLKFPTFVKTAALFTKSMTTRIRGDVLYWHTSLFYHFLVYELVSNVINPDNIISFLTVLCKFIECRNKESTFQLQRLYILLFLKKNFELEELFGESMADTPQNETKQLSNNHSYSSFIEEEEENKEENKMNDKDEFSESKDTSSVPHLKLFSQQIGKNNEQQTEYKDQNDQNQKGNENEDSEEEMSKEKDNSFGNEMEYESVNEYSDDSQNNETDNTPIVFVPQLSFSKMTVRNQNNSKNNISYNDLSDKMGEHNLENPKLQLQFQKTTKLAPIRRSVTLNNGEYIKKRLMYPIYTTDEIHLLFIKTMFDMLIDHTLHRLDVVFCDPFPFMNKKPNVLFTLMQHMESTANMHLKDSLFNEVKKHIDNLQNRQKDESPIVPLINTLLLPLNNNMCNKNNDNNNRILKNNGNKDDKKSKDVNENEPPEITRILRIDRDNPHIYKSIISKRIYSVPKFFKEVDRLKKPPKEKKPIISDSKRLMRLTMPCLFDPDAYINGRHIANGAFGSVMVVPHENGNEKELYAVKILKKSRNEYDNPHLYEVFTEVSILEMCQGDRRVTQLKDYGCVSNSYYIIMEYYPTTLKSWRKNNKEPKIETILRLYRDFLTSCTVLTDYHINHFDIKCDNVMLDKSGHACLADFGEAMSYTDESNSFTMLNKGTEWIKSPEMLSIALNSTITNPNFDRRKKIGAGPASDVWSIGCLFYELVTGEYLFAETNWSHFFRRITEEDQELVLSDNMLKMPKDTRFCGFLEFVLQRNARSRPNLHQVISKFDEMFPEALNSNLPIIEIPAFE